MLAATRNEMGRPLTAKGFRMNLNQDANETHIDAFLAAAHRRKYPAKSTLIYAGDKSDSIYFIQKGSVTVLVEDESGREIIVAYLNKGDFLAKCRSLLTTPPDRRGLKLRPNVRLQSFPTTSSRNLSIDIQIYCMQ